MNAPRPVSARPPDPAALLAPVTLVLGGARSGKSRHAEGLVLRHARAAGCRPVYLATAEAGDAEMAARIARHRADRGPGWGVIEEPLALPERLGEAARDGAVLLVDCLTLWLSNLMGRGRDPDAAADALTARLPGLAAPVVFVANEVGLGIVPDNAAARAFRDRAGRLNQAVAAVADEVVFVAAGLPLLLKGRPR